jgi:molybdate transport system substrate-binding protein
MVAGQAMRRDARRAALGAAMLASSWVLTACGSGGSTGPAVTSGSGVPAAAPAAAPTSTAETIVTGPAGTLVVFADASLRPVLPGLGTSFESMHPGVKVNLIFGESAQLVARIDHGGAGDVFAAADVPTMQQVIDADQVTEQPQEFAKNVLTIVTAPGNPKHLATLADLTRPGVSVAVCAATTSCGASAARAESDAGVELSAASALPSGTEVANRVAAGQADAGLVYLTDAKAAGGSVAQVAFPQAAREINVYPMAVLAGSKQATLAHAFETLVTGPDGRAAVAATGFGAPH